MEGVAAGKPLAPTVLIARAKAHPAEQSATPSAGAVERSGRASERHHDAWSTHLHHPACGVEGWSVVVSTGLSAVLLLLCSLLSAVCCLLLPYVGGRTRITAEFELR